MYSLSKYSLSKYFILASLCLLLGSRSIAQSTTVSGQVTDLGGQAWNNGTFTFQFIPNNNFPSSTYSWTGGVLNQSISGSLNATGGYSQSVPSNTSITPSLSQWRLQVCSGTTPVNCFTVTQTITGGSQTVNVTPTAIIVPPGAGNTAYVTSEVSPAIVGSQIYIFGLGLQTCSTVSGGVCTVWTGGSSSSSSSSSPSSAYTFYPVSGTSCAAQNYSPIGTFYCAFPGLPNGDPTYSGTDFAVVFNSVTTLRATVGGKLSWRIGVYNINSLTDDSSTGCSNFDGSAKQISYGMVFPANTVPTSVQWILEGESAPVWQGEEGSTTVNNNGTILNVTAAAVSSVTANNILAGLWQRPGQNCTLTVGAGFPSPNIGNDIHVKNMSLRFPTNQRGNEIAFAPYFGLNIEYENVVADFNLPYNTIATGPAPVAGSYGSFGFATTVSGSGNWQNFTNTFSVGYNLGYDFQSEHVMGHTVTAIYNNIACEFGRSATGVFHPSEIHNFEDQENAAGCIFGPQVALGTRFDIWFDFEFGGGDSNWYTTARNQRGLLVESAPGNAGGNIYYQVTIANTGIVVGYPAAGIWSVGGQNFQMYEASGQTNIALLPGRDTFTRRDNATMGAGWTSISGLSTLRVTSNSATATNAAGSASIWTGPQVQSDQFSQGVINTVDASGVSVIVRGSTSALLTYNDYLCVPGSFRKIRKRVTGTITDLLTNASGTCAVGDTMKLVVIGSTYWGYFTHTGVTTVDGPITDASITTGSPGLLAGTTNTDSWINWTGGSLPTFSTSATIYSQPFIAPTYSTLTNCASSGGTCSSASSGSVSIAAAATTVTVSTTAVTANSVIILSRDDTLGTKLGVTCNTATAAGDIKASTRTAGTSFVITVQNAPAANPLCLNYWIVN